MFEIFYYKFVELLVLTKTYIFRKLIFITLFFALVLMLSSSFAPKFDEPLWVTFLESSDGVIHTCHRKDYLEFMELVNCDDEQIPEELESYYEKCDYLIKHDDYLHWEYVDKKANFKTVDNYYLDR